MYAKVFASLWDGTLAGKPDDQLVFIFLLARSDPNGYVDVEPKVIGFLTGIGEERTRLALERLEGQDWDSRTPDNDGRRLERVSEHRSWGWRIINYAKYRAIHNAHERREQNREAQRRHRSTNHVSICQHPSAMSAQEEVEVEVEVKSQHPCPISSDGLPVENPENRESKAKASPKENPEAVRIRNDWAEFFETELWPNRPRANAPGPTASESKAKALASWTRLCPKGGDYAAAQRRANEVCSALEADVRAMRAEGREASKCPHLVTWLNQSRWEA